MSKPNATRLRRGVEQSALQFRRFLPSHLALLNAGYLRAHRKREKTYLVCNHVLQLLVIYGSTEYVRLQRYASDSTVEQILAAVPEAALHKRGAQLFNWVSTESSSLSTTMEWGTHAKGDIRRVHEYVRADSRRGKDNADFYLFHEYVGCDE